MSQLKLLFMGVLMGIADLIPGISGGTVAYLLGFYDRLIGSLKTFSLATCKSWYQQKAFPKELKEALFFLSWLFLGIIFSLLVFSKMITFFLSVPLYRSYLYSLFFGVVLGSIHKMKKKVAFWGKRQIFSFGLGALLSFGISLAYFQKGEVFSLTTFPSFSPYIVASGMLTIFAMLLPGISGSYILLLLGLYAPAVEALSLLIYLDGKAFQLLFQLALGAILGFLTFAHILHYLNLHFKDRLQASLLGFLFGSLYFIWPFSIKQAQEGVIYSNKQLVLCFLFFLLGAFLLSRTTKKEKKVLPLVES